MCGLNGGQDGAFCFFFGAKPGRFLKSATHGDKTSKAFYMGSIPQCPAPHSIITLEATGISFYPVMPTDIITSTSAEDSKIIAGPKRNHAVSWLIGVADLSIPNMNKILCWMIIVLLSSLFVFWATCFLPFNRFALLSTYRRVIPSQDCKEIIIAAEEHAAAVMAAAASTPGSTLEASGGWRTERHKSYATTDFELRSIPSATALWNTKLKDKVLPLVADQVREIVRSEKLLIADVFLVTSL